jgi:hypothetical protein
MTFLSYPYTVAYRGGGIENHYPLTTTFAVTPLYATEPNKEYRGIRPQLFFPLNPTKVAILDLPILDKWD